MLLKNREEFKALVYKKYEEKKSKQYRLRKYRAILLPLSAALILCCILIPGLIQLKDDLRFEVSGRMNYISISVNAPQHTPGSSLPDNPTFSPNPEPPYNTPDFNGLIEAPSAKDLIQNLKSGNITIGKPSEPSTGSSYDGDYNGSYYENCYTIDVWYDSTRKVQYKFYDRSKELYANNVKIKLSIAQQTELSNILKKYAL